MKLSPKTPRMHWPAEASSRSIQTKAFFQIYRLAIWTTIQSNNCCFFIVILVQLLRRPPSCFLALLKGHLSSRTNFTNFVDTLLEFYANPPMRTPLCEPSVHVTHRFVFHFLNLFSLFIFSSYCLRLSNIFGQIKSIRCWRSSQLFVSLMIMWRAYRMGFCVLLTHFTHWLLHSQISHCNRFVFMVIRILIHDHPFIVKNLKIKLRL